MTQFLQHGRGAGASVTQPDATSWPVARSMMATRRHGGGWRGGGEMYTRKYNTLLACVDVDGDQW